MLKTSLTAAFVLLATAALAHADTLSALRGRYTITPASEVAFSVDQIGGGGISGVFGRFSGSIDLRPEAVARSGVAFELRPESVATGEPRVEKFLRSDAVFDVEKHPVITFRSTRIRQDGPDSAVIDGILTARGITHRESFKATLIERKGRKVAFHVVGDVYRSLYDMGVGTPIYSNIVRFDMVFRGERK